MKNIFIWTAQKLRVGRGRWIRGQQHQLWWPTTDIKETMKQNRMFERTICIQYRNPVAKILTFKIKVFHQKETKISGQVPKKIENFKFKILKSYKFLIQIYDFKLIPLFGSNSRFLWKMPDLNPVHWCACTSTSLCFR